MADGSANVAGATAWNALEVAVSASTTGFSVSIKIGNTILAGIVSVGALSLGAYYLANRRPVENAIRNGLEIRNEAGVLDPEVRNIEEGSILVELRCHSEQSFIQFVEDFEAKKVEHRLKEEFTKIGFSGRLHVTIRNTNEVYGNVQMVRSSQKESKTKKVEDKEVQKASEDRARAAVVSDKLVRDICDNVGTCWDDLGIKLNLSAAVVRNIDADFRRCREKAREILQRWMEKQGDAATVGRLEDALLAIGQKACAEKLLALQIDQQNKGQRENAQISRSRAHNSDHGNPSGVSFGVINVGPGSNFNFVGTQYGGFNMNAPKQE